MSLARPLAGTKGYDPTDLVSVVRVILHYKKTTHATLTAPTELVSVERMMLHFARRIVANHGFYPDRR